MRTPEPIRALIVDDDPVVARSVARRLLREGYTVSLAGTCRAARTAGCGFDAAVLDLDLPDGSGAQLAEELLRQGAVKAVVFYTGSLDATQRERAALLGTVVDKGQEFDEVMLALESFVHAPPVSRLNASPRTSSSGDRFVRVLPGDEVTSVAAVSAARSSSR